MGMWQYQYNTGITLGWFRKNWQNQTVLYYSTLLFQLHYSTPVFYCTIFQFHYFTPLFHSTVLLYYSTLLCHSTISLFNSTVLISLFHSDILFYHYFIVSPQYSIKSVYILLQYCIHILVWFLLISSKSSWCYPGVILVLLWYTHIYFWKSPEKKLSLQDFTLALISFWALFTIS